MNVQKKNKNDIQIKPFKLPQSLLSQLNECTRSYILISANDKNEPEVHVNFDNSVEAIGLMQFAKMWADNCEQINTQINLNNIIGRKKSNEEEPDDKKIS
jgi:hypothetical protein